MVGMQLRASSMLRVPGRYQEDLGPSRADRPIFVHPDVPFNPDLVQHCAHPSLPLDHPGLGPSEEEAARLAALAAERRAAAVIEDTDEESDSDESLDEEDGKSNPPFNPFSGVAGVMGVLGVVLFSEQPPFRPFSAVSFQLSQEDWESFCAQTGVTPEFIPRQLKPDKMTDI
jgi:hypothetical protein